MNQLYALTIAQPWAWAIAKGFKLSENRVWKTSIRGRIAIHAGKSDKFLADGLGFLDRASAQFHRPDWRMPPVNFLTFGAIVATAELVDCVEIADMSAWLDANPTIPSLGVAPWSFGPYCWIFRDVCKLANPIVCNGAQGLWKVNPELRDQLAAKGAA